MVGEGELECGALGGHDFFSFGEGVGIAAFAETGLHVVLKAVEGGDEPGVVLLHELCAFLVEHCAVFDGVDASAGGGLDSGSAFGVGHHFFAGAVSDLNGGGHLGFAQLLNVEVGDGVHDAAGGHELDPIGSVLDVAADDVGDVVDGVGDVRSTWAFHICREGRAVTVAAGEGDAAAGSSDAGAEDDAAFDGVAQGELRVVGGAFAGVAKRSEAVIEPESEIVDAPEGVLRDGGSQANGDALGCGVGESVCVRIDEAGDDGVGGEIGDGNAGGGGVRDGLNAFASDHDVGVLTDVAGSDVNEFAGEDGLRCRGLLGFLGRGDTGEAEDDNCGEKQGS